MKLTPGPSSLKGFPVKKIFALMMVLSLAAIGCDDKKSTNTKPADKPKTDAPKTDCAEDGHPEGRYAEDRHPEGRYAEGRHPEGRHPEDRWAGSSAPGQEEGREVIPERCVRTRQHGDVSDSVA